MPSPKPRIFEHFAEIARVLGHAHRLFLLEYLGQGERSVEALAGLAELSLANTSRHLQSLKQGGFVVSRRAGKHVLYRLADARVVDLIAALRAYAEGNGDVARLAADYLHRRDELEPVTRAELKKRLNDRKTVVLDVRPEDEYALGHIAGARNIPATQLKRRIAELPKSQEIIAYCRGPYCFLSFEAVAALRKHGFRVRRLEDGFPEWAAAGFKTETGATLHH
jgi:ArsR family transcriptional regulator